MPRYALKIEYHGGPFAGWQKQPGGQRTVQTAIEDALDKIDSGAHAITAAGRTDAGVHATAQVAHADLARDWDPFRLSEAINWHLKPQPAAVVRAARVPDTFHARFDALERQYFFRLLARRAPAIHDRGLVWQVLKPLDLERMREGAAHLIGHHDFTTFRSTFCQAKSPQKTLDEITITEHPYAEGTEYRFFLRARSFLHNQVRSIIGTLERVGYGTWSAQDVRTALAARDRAACGPVCPPQGLYLSAVKYALDPFAD
jgi:tRNA pseudouridine38-40 synthase